MSCGKAEILDNGQRTTDNGLKLRRSFWSIVHCPLSTVRSLISLTKPTIVLSFTLTGATALVIEGSLLQNLTKFFLVLLAILLTAAGANGLNQYFERDLDARMERTKNRRPLPLGKIDPTFAFWFSTALGVAAIFYLALFINVLSAAIALGTILFYSFFYTLWLKPRTHYNIVIGGAAGATAPLIAWAAATGEISVLAWILFGIIFLWTPPHFWALALCVKDQYAKAGIPMLPVVKGEGRTRSEILLYSILLVLFSFLPLLLKGGVIYFSGAAILGLILLQKGWKTYVQKTQKAAYGLFGYSILYLMTLFIVMMIDARIPLELSF